jgi:hypothetical protein
LLGHYHGEIADPTKDTYAHVAAVSDKMEIHGSPGDLQVRDPQFRHEAGQSWLVEPDLPFSPAYTCF